MRGLVIAIGKILAFLGIWAVLLGAVVMTAVQIGGDAWHEQARWRLWLESGGFIAILAALLVMARLVDKRGWRTLGLNLNASMVGLLAGAALGAAIFAAPLAVLMLLGAARYQGFAGLDAGALALALTLCAFNVLHQELLVRSYMFQEVWRRYGAAAAIAVTSMFSLLLHAAPIVTGGLAGIIVATNIGLASVMLGLAYVRSKALWLPIGIHFGWNALQGPVLGINVTGAEIGGGWRAFSFAGDPLLTGGGLGVEGGLVGLLGPAIGLAVILFASSASAAKSASELVGGGSSKR